MAVIFISVTVLVVVITSTVFMFLFSDNAYSTKKTLLMNTAEAYSAMMTNEECTYSDGLSFAKLPDYTSVTAAIGEASVWIYKIDGYFLTDNPGHWPLSASDLSQEQFELIERAENGEKIISTAFSDNFGQETLSAMVPIYDKSTEYSYVKHVVGVAVIHSSTGSIRHSMSDVFKTVLATFTIAVAIAAIVAFFLSRKVTNPIREMSVAASKLAKGDFSVHLDINDSDELSELSVSLNRLASNLDNSFTKLKNERDKLSNIINNISDGIAAFDTNLKLIQYNPSLISMCNEGQFESQKLHDMLMQVLQNGTQQTVIIEGKDILKFTAARIFNGNIVEGVVVIVQDISQSERLEKLRNEFVANVSHEFRTPLTIIKGSVEILTDGVLDTEEEKMPYYKRIETETTALEKLVKDLLDTSKFKAGKIVIELKRFDINPLLADIAAKMRDVAEKKKQVRLAFSGSSLPDIMGDTDRLRQVFIILLDNAIKFTPEKGAISFSTRYDDSYAYFTVRDTGIGISEEDLPFVFERFYKADKSRGGSETGSGLGLSIAWHIAELHHGTIQVESELGVGTAFTVIIPLAKDDDFPEDDYGDVSDNETEISLADGLPTENE